MLKRRLLNICETYETLIITNNITGYVTVTGGGVTYLAQTCNANIPYHVQIPDGVTYTISNSAVPDYNAPSNVSYTAVGKSTRNVTRSYTIKKERVYIKVTGTNATVTISYNGGVKWTQSCVAGTQYYHDVNYGTSYTIAFSGVQYYNTPNSITYTASQTSRTIVGAYSVNVSQLYTTYDKIELGIPNETCNCYFENMFTASFKGTRDNLEFVFGVNRWVYASCSTCTIIAFKAYSNSYRPKMYYDEYEGYILNVAELDSFRVKSDRIGDITFKMYPYLNTGEIGFDAEIISRYYTITENYHISEDDWYYYDCSYMDWDYPPTTPHAFNYSRDQSSYNDIELHYIKKAVYKGNTYIPALRKTDSVPGLLCKETAHFCPLVRSSNNITYTLT